MIEISKLNAWFDDHHVLKDVNITVPKKRLVRSGR